MCGIVGILNNGKAEISQKTLKGMTRTIGYRGPDGEGFYLNDTIAFGHRRLAVIDLSPAASQPMHSPDGRYVLAYNGEVFNFKEIRQRLVKLGYVFQSKSDTEVVLNALIEWDTEALSEFNGMFALAFHDKETDRILMARDRYGIKPLYISSISSGYLFGSEIKAFLKHPDFKVKVNVHALNQYFTFQNMLGSETLFKDVELLSPGHYQVFRRSNGSWEPSAPVQYWEFSFHPEESLKDPEETAGHLFALIEQAVNRQMVSDVPLGSYLSGGIDSSTIVAIASKTVPRLTTFTGGFDLSSAQGMEAGYDERAAAEVLSNQFMTEHYEMVMHAGDMAYVLPRLVWHLEELRLGQCYPNYYLARLASKFVKVILCGAGGDELFAGYPWRYFGSANCSENGRFLRSYYNFWQRLVPDENKLNLFQEWVYRQIEPESCFNAFSNVLAATGHGCQGIEANINRSLYFEAKSFLHGLLMVEDKLSMAHGLETRVPFLDNDFVDFACRIPVNMKLKNLTHIPRIDENELGKAFQYHERCNDGKRILRQAVARLVPPEIAERAKQGFSSPDISWYRGESLNYVKGLLTQGHPYLNEYIKPEFIKSVLEAHWCGRRNFRLLIWSLLCFEWWLRIFLGDFSFSASQLSGETQL